MRLRIENIERLSGLGDYDSPYVVSFAENLESYAVIMEWGGHTWNVVLYRKPDENMKYLISVQIIGKKMRLETTPVNLDEYRSPGIILSIIESLMRGCLKQKV